MPLQRSKNDIKLTFLGEGAVGKSTLAHRLIHHEFTPNLKMTIGIDFQTLFTEILDPLAPETEDAAKIPLNVQIWDFSGQEHFRFFLPRYCRGTNTGLLMYDLSRFTTQVRLHEWLELWRENAPSDANLFLVGTKADLLSEEDLQEAQRQAERLAQEFGCQRCYQISSKTGLRTALLLEDILESAYICNVRQLGQTDERSPVATTTN